MFFWAAGLAGFNPAEQSGDRLLQLALLPHGCFFALGIWLSACAGRGRTALAVAGAVAMSGVAAVEIVHHARLSTSLTGIWTPAAIPLALFAFGVAGLAGAERLQRPLARWCSPANARRLGSATYPLYLLHQDAGAALIGPLARAGVPVAVAICMTASIAIAASVAIGDRAEPALRRLLTRTLTRRRNPVPDIPPNASLPIG
jgi:peptidoglycan/LPS O-acetylase OafA/YrhL